MRLEFHKLAVAALFAAFSSSTLAQTFHERLIAIPEGAWAKLNTNRFDSSWRLDNQAPTPQAPDIIGRPKAIIQAWSSMAWDSRRGDLIIWGGGHANYAGNEIYRWRSSSLRWQIASLPSQVVEVNPSFAMYEAVDGNANAPIAAHTYDNQEYLPNIDRFVSFGGASYNSGEYWADATRTVKAGPYFWNPNLAHPDRVGGSLGSHANTALYRNVAAGAMWNHRNNLASRSNMADDYPGKSFAGFINGGTAYHNDNGRDVLYVCDFDLWRYTVGDVNNPGADLYEKVGKMGVVSGQGPGAYDPVRKLFVKSYGITKNFIFWNLNTPGPTNPARTITLDVRGGTFNIADVGNYGMDFDPVRNHFVLWVGNGEVWRLTPPADPLTQPWVLEPVAPTVTTVVPVRPATGFTGILGKWKYISEYDIFLGLYDPFSGDIWAYKPVGWQPSANLNADRTAPQVAIVSPSLNATLSNTVQVTVSASDANPVAGVDLYAGGYLVGSDNSEPYEFAFNTGALNNGLTRLRAEARDAAGNAAFSDGVMVTINNTGGTPNNAPSVSIDSPANAAEFASGAAVAISASASDADGSVTQVEFFANGTTLGIDTLAPYTRNWTPSAAGTYILTAKATDNLGSTSTSTGVSVTIRPPNQAPTVTLTNPLAGSALSLGSTVAVRANATDADGSVASVEFLVNGTRVGFDVTAPYEADWSPTLPGSYTVTAVATDNNGATGSATVGGITVSDGSSLTMVLQDGINGYAGTTDSDVSSFAVNTNYGTAQQMIDKVGSFAAFVRFAIFQSQGGMVPDGAEIVSAKLALYKYSFYDYRYNLHRVLVPWDERQVTWSSRLTGVPWSSASGAGLGTDIAASASATATIGWNPAWLEFDVTNAVREFGSGTANYGWRLVPVSGNSNAKRFYSSEHTATPALRPTLTVTYRLP